jgi:predicted phage replisome organizer
MADNKKYYYMRLKENFFDSSEISLLESMPDGYLYSNILLKLYLRSLRGEGRLAVNNIPYSPEMISTVTHHPVETVQKALDIFQNLGLIEILDSGVIYMLNIQEFIGASSTEADRIRAYRQRIVQEKGVQMYDKHTPEIEIELEKEIKNTEYINADALTESVVPYFFRSYEDYTGHPHPSVHPDKLQEVLSTLTEYDADQDFVDAYFGDEAHKGLCGDSDCSIFHFASPAVLELLYSRVYGGKH